MQIHYCQNLYTWQQIPVKHKDPEAMLLLHLPHNHGQNVVAGYLNEQFHKYKNDCLSSINLHLKKLKVIYIYIYTVIA